MRSFFVCLSLFVLTAATANAQNFRLGISAGIDAARASFSGASGGPVNYKTDIAGGIVAEAVISPLFSVQLEGNYSTQGAAVIHDDASTVGSYNFTYITVPLLAKLNAHKGLSFLAGPQVGFLIDAETQLSGSPDTDAKDMLESIDVYAVFGAEYRFANGVFVGTRYNTGLTNIIKDKTTDQDIKNRYFSFRLGYSFAL
jgi:hypothetical protein